MAGVAPSGVEIRNVSGEQVFVVEPSVVTQVLLSKTCGMRPGLGAVAPKLEAAEVNETYKPSAEIDGFELGWFPGVTPSAVETRYVVAAQALVGVAPLHVERM